MFHHTLCPPLCGLQNQPLKTWMWPLRTKGLKFLCCLGWNFSSFKLLKRFCRVQEPVGEVRHWCWLSSTVSLHTNSPESFSVCLTYYPKAQTSQKPFCFLTLLLCQTPQKFNWLPFIQPAASGIPQKRRLTSWMHLIRFFRILYKNDSNSFGLDEHRLTAV